MTNTIADNQINKEKTAPYTTYYIKHNFPGLNEDFEIKLINTKSGVLYLFILEIQSWCSQNCYIDLKTDLGQPLKNHSKKLQVMVSVWKTHNIFKEFKTKSHTHLPTFQGKHKYSNTKPADLLEQIEYVSIEYIFSSALNLEL